MLTVLKVSSPQADSTCSAALEKAQASVEEAATATAASGMSTSTSSTGSEDSEGAAAGNVQGMFLSMGSMASAAYAIFAMGVGAGMVLL